MAPGENEFATPALEDILAKILLYRISEVLLPMFSSRTFMISWLTFKSFIHFGIYFLK